MNIKEFNHTLFEYLQSSPSAFHAISQMRESFSLAGMIELRENQQWELASGNSYFVVRENGALVAFTLGSEETLEDGFRMVASHSDSPGLQIKPQATIDSPPYLQFGVEVYGGPLLTTWFDRDLSIAGRVCCRDTHNHLFEYLIDFQRPMLVIPSLAIHLNREANKEFTVDCQKHLPPLVGQALAGQLPDFQTILQEQVANQYPHSAIEEVLSFDLFCYDFQGPGFLGYDREFICSGRLDNLLSCHVAASALNSAGTERNMMFLCTNHEENGSTSTTGARSSFIETIFQRLLPSHEHRQIALRNSFLISMDNAHAVHPNFKDKSDPVHTVILNGGPVIKLNANQRYATSSRSSAIFKTIALAAEVPTQEFVMRSDMPCGSTIGPMTAARLGVTTVDVGAPTLSMHSIRELTGANDPFLLYQIINKFFNSDPYHRQI